MLPYNPDLKAMASYLRANLTDSERKLWRYLRRKQVMGVQFYRQKPVGMYIVDFYAPRAKLVVEIDGSQHMQEAHVLKDSRRDAYLNSQGLVVLRFNSRETLLKTKSVVEKISEIVRSRLES